MVGGLGLRRFATVAVAVGLALSACGGHLESLPDVWPGAYPDAHRGVVPSETDAGLTVDLLSFNIKFDDPSDEENPWGARRSIVADLIRDDQPDVVGLQEALRSQLDDLGPPEPYRLIGVGRDDGKRAGEHSAILYRSDRFTAESEGTFWLSKAPEVPGSAGWGNQIPRVCTWAHLVERSTKRAFYVFNTHLDARSQPSRAHGVELISQRIAERRSPDPVVVMGDFNATEDNPTVQYLTGRAARASDVAFAPPSPALVDTFRIKHPSATGIGTLHRWSGRTSGRKVDYIFVPAAPAGEVLDAAILHARRGGRYPSDHFPVRARVWLATP